MESLRIPSLWPSLPAQAATFLTLRSAILVRICQLGPHPHTWLQSPFSLHWQTLHLSFGWGWGSGRKYKCTQSCREERPKRRKKGWASQSAPRPESSCPSLRGPLLQKITRPERQGHSRRTGSLAGLAEGVSSLCFLAGPSRGLGLGAGKGRVQGWEWALH